MTLLFILDRDSQQWGWLPVLEPDLNPQSSEYLISGDQDFIDFHFHAIDLSNVVVIRLAYLHLALSSQPKP